MSYLETTLQYMATRSKNEAVMDILIRAKEGNVVKLQIYLRNADVDINFTNDAGFSALLLAVELGETQNLALDTLIKAGADIELRNNDGLSAIMLAIMKRKVDILVSLTKAGADVNIRDFRQRGKTPLIVACMKGYQPCVQALIEAGAKINICDEEENTPLSLAANQECVKTLIEGGADVNYCTTSGMPTISLLTSADRVQMLFELGAQTEPDDLRQVSPLMHAAEKGNVVAVEGLLQCGADPNRQDSNGMTALMRARNVESVKVLLEAGASTELTDCRGRTALMIAASKNTPPVLDALLKSRADPDKQDDESKSAWLHAGNIDNFKTLLMTDCSTHKVLIFAAFKGNIKVVQALLNTGVDPNMKDEAGTTALMCAATPECSRALLQAGADTEITDERGRSALMFAAWGGNLSVLHVLLENDADPTRQDMNGWTALTCINNPDCLNALIEAGADVDQTDNSGLTTLMFSTRRGKLAVLHRLLQSGADPNRQDKMGMTALMYAVDVKCTEALLKNGADIAKTDKNGRNALMITAIRSNVPVLQALLERGLDPNKHDNSGQSALMLAKSKECISVLLTAGAVYMKVDSKKISGFSTECKRCVLS